MARLTDEQISALLDGTAEAELAARVSRDPELTAQMEEARLTEAALSATLHRWDCPAPETLGDYAVDMLPEVERSGVARHLALCLRCHKELAILTNFLADEGNLPAVTVDAPVVSIPPNRWNEIRMRPSVPTSPIAWRGSSKSTSTVFEAPGLTLFIEYSQEGQQLQLSGQLVTDEPDDQAGWGRALVELRQDGNVTTTSLDADGEFTFERLEKSEQLVIRITNESGTSIVWSQSDG